ncbi:MAG: phenylalanine--tRNA ligase subunit beta [Deltaproteobacteria bacterium]|nr:phenylalanine--tRNA ligase subunit beta [Deltaproteobacteria bacterium]
MQISFNWIKQYVELDVSAHELADALTMAGLEVEGVSKRYPDLDRVVVARILEIMPHPNADKLRICRVDLGNERLDVVCGAPNIAEGQRVPLALEGAVLPSGVRVRKAQIRGVNSAGMICSEVELQVGDDASGIMVLDAEAPEGVPLAEALSLNDYILEVSVTPNRPDCMNALGLAREAAALFGKRVRYPETGVVESGAPISDQTSVTLEDPIGCPRYSARLIRNIRLGPSPFWLRQKLISAGLRSINNIVDVTNYVLMEFGQPLHAFDFNRLEEHRIVVRSAVAGERFTTLDGQERELPDGALMICDGKKPVALAGIMGGLNSEIEDSTRDVLIESAYFNPVTIRRTSKRLGLSTEASYRFERGIDPEGTVRALDRATRLLVELAGGEVAHGAIDEYPEVIPRRVIPLRVDRANRFLGTDVSQDEMKRCLTAIELDVTDDGPGRFQVSCPTFRPDLEREVDLWEEVARIYGYNAIPVTYPPSSRVCRRRAKGRLNRMKALTVAQGAGYTEVVNYSFVSPRWIEKCLFEENDFRRRCIPILNPLNEEQSVMRTTLLPGLLTNVQRNVAFKNEDLKLLEVGKVYFPDGADTPADERFMVSGVHSGLREPFSWRRPNDRVDFLDIKGAVSLLLEAFRVFDAEFVPQREDPLFALGESARLLVRGTALGVLGRMSDRVLHEFDISMPLYAFELNLDLLSRYAEPDIKARPLPRFPSVVRDLAVIVPQGASAGDVRSVISNHAHKQYVEDIRLFDVYEGDQIAKDEVSLAFRITYRAEDKTLSDEMVNKSHEKLIQAVLKATNGRLRI